MEISLSINPADPMTIFVFIFLGLGGQLWVAWFIRQMSLAEETPDLARVRVIRLLLAGVNILWGAFYLYWVGLGASHFISNLLQANERGNSSAIYILGILIQAIAIAIWGIKYVRRTPIDIPKAMTWLKEDKNVWVTAFSILVDEIHLLLGFGFVLEGVSYILSGDVEVGLSDIVLGISLMVSGYLVIKLGKTFEKGISWSCVIFGIGILARYLLSAIFKENFWSFPVNLGVGVLDVTHGLIGAGVLMPKNIRQSLRIVVGDFIEIWGLITIAVSIFTSNEPMLILGIGIFAQAWGFLVGGKWITAGMIFLSIGLLPLGVSRLDTEIVSLLIPSVVLPLATFVFLSVWGCKA